MKQLKILFMSMFLLVVTIFALSSSSYGANSTYTLLPGSTITPMYGGDTEALTGTFQWTDVDSQFDLIVFNATYLRFESPSYLITLNTTPLNDVGTSVFTGSNSTYFMEVVDLVGLPISTGEILSNPAGTYTGPSYRPDFLSYSNMDIFPVNGGGVYAKVNLVAAVAPEPVSSILFITGGTLLAGGRYIRRKA